MKKEKKQNSIEFSRNEYKKEYKQSSRGIQLVLGILVLVVLILLGYYISKKDDLQKIANQKKHQIEQEKRTKKRQTELTQRAQAYQKIISDGEIAYQEGKYFKAAFSYNQAIQYDENNIELYEKLILALKKSCALGNEIHCNRETDLKNKISLIKKNGSLKRVDKRDSIILQIE